MAQEMTLEESVDSLCCEACGEPVAGEDGTPVDAQLVDHHAATDDGALMCCPVCVDKFKAEGATLDADGFLVRRPIVTLDHVNPDADNPEFCAKCSRPLGQPHVDTCPVVAS